MITVWNKEREYIYIEDPTAYMEIFFENSSVNKKFLSKLPFISVSGKVNNRWWYNEVLPSNWVVV